MVTVHDGVVGRDVTCHWVNTLRPFAFTCHKNPTLWKHVSESMVVGPDLRLDRAAFQKWLDVTLRGGSLSNLLRMLVVVLDLRGVPSYGVYPPSVRI
jgi:hypothetical protein